MATPVIAVIADEMLAYFKKAGITDARRNWINYTDREELATRRVVVVPKNRRKERGSRSHDHKVYELEIHVQQEVDPNDNQTLDNLVATVDSIWDLYEEDGSLRDATLNGCKWSGELEFDLDQLYDSDALRDDKLFSSVTVVRYRKDE